MSKPTLKMTHGAIGEAMCCYTNGSYKDAEIALIEYENSIRADGQTTVLEELLELKPQIYSWLIKREADGYGTTSGECADKIFEEIEKVFKSHKY